MARRHRNLVNQMVSRAKSIFIKTKLRENSNNPNKFWRVINDIINPAKGQTNQMHLLNKDTGVFIEFGREADFLNDYFLNIVRNLDIVGNDDLCQDVYNIQNRFCFLDNMPTVQEVIKLISDIDISKSSCVDGISAKFCKLAMLSVPNHICRLFCTSLETGTVPKSWTKGTITELPKDSDLSEPGNWRPITQTSLFAKILEKIVHVRLFRYLMENNIISEYQFGFLPGRSTQLAVFELSKQILSAMNNKKIFGSICLDISKAFDCIDHTRLYNKLQSIGVSELVMRWFKSYFSRSQEVKGNNIRSQTCTYWYWSRENPRPADFYFLY